VGKNVQVGLWCAKGFPSALLGPIQDRDRMAVLNAGFPRVRDWS